MYNIQEYFSLVQALTPELWVAAAIILACLWNLFFPRMKSCTPLFALAALAMAIVDLCQQFSLLPKGYFEGQVFVVDKLTVAFGVLSCLVGMVVVLMTMGYERHFGQHRGEFYAILLTAVMAVMILAGTTNLILLFVALETLSLCCVILSGMFKKDRKSNEAALKYLLSTAATTATLMYGMSFVYGLTGSLSYNEIHVRMAAAAQSPSLVVILLLVLLLSGIGFKLSTVPFHMWTPDVYEGAPTPVTAFLSIGSKLGGFVVAIRLLCIAFGTASADWSVVLGVLAILSMIGGNLIALAQTSLKRMLAYSSIAHVGYMLIGLVANTAEGLSAMTFYLIVYGMMNLGAFTGAILFSNETGSDNIDDFGGLIRKRPWLAIGLSICLLNLAGLPVPPAGFLAKAFVFWSGVQMSSNLGWAMVITALVTSVPAIYYYTRVVIKMVVREPSEKVSLLPEARIAMSDNQAWPIAALWICVIGIIAGSIMVNPFMSVARDSVSQILHLPAIGSLPAHLN